MHKILRVLSVVAVTAVLSACGGGGGGGSSGGSGSGGGGGGTTWVSGVFQSAGNFKNRCEVRRTGVDSEGNSFPDIQGTALDEKNWLRSWTRETYLWNTEVTDTNPASGGTRIQYFATLKTFAKTTSGKDKDDFHFSESTAEYLARRNSAATASYGAELVVLSATVPRDVRVVFTEPGTPASELDGGVPKLKRGTQILRVNGIDLVNGGSTQAEIDALNKALFSPSAGVANTFVVQDIGSSSTRTISLTPAILTPKSVNRTQVLDTPTGKVGYILFNTFSPYASEREIMQAMQQVSAAGVSDLVLDLRYNGGGLLAVASQVSYMIAGNSRTSGRNFERLRFNAAAGSRNPVTGNTNNPVPFYTTGLGFSVSDGTALPSLNLPRVYILTTENTCSASEAVINGLRGIGVEVVLIGGKTCGKPYGFYPQDNCGETYYTIQFQGVNDVGFGDYADGFIANNSSEAFGVRLPGCTAQDQLTQELGDVNEGLLSTALWYRANGSCPVPASSVASAAMASRGDSDSTSTLIFGPQSLAIEAPAPRIMDVNRDMSMPK